MDVAIDHDWWALVSEAGYVEVSDRTHLAVQGRDRARLLHGLCTNEIRALAPGAGCEAFLTNVQGRTIGHVLVYVAETELLLDAPAGETATIQHNLDRYLIREDVQFVDRGPTEVKFLVSGARAPEIVQDWLGTAPPSAPVGIHFGRWRDETIGWLRTPWAGSQAFYLIAPRTLLADLVAEMSRRGIRACSPAALETVRIEAGFPRFGADVTAENLPQEVDRNAVAISFKKGCYLGQETVARLDALGHVNRTLCGLRFPGPELPPAGGEVRVGEKLQAKITSVCFSPRLQAPLALAYVRAGSNQPGMRWPTPWGEAEVVSFPLAK